MFSCEFCGISKNTFFIENLWATATVSTLLSRRCWQFSVESLGPPEANL